MHNWCGVRMDFDLEDNDVLVLEFDNAGTFVSYNVDERKAMLAFHLSYEKMAGMLARMEKGLAVRGPWVGAKSGVSDGREDD